MFGTETFLRKPCHDLSIPTSYTYTYIYIGELGPLSPAKFVIWRDGNADPIRHANGAANDFTILSIWLGVCDGPHTESVQSATPSQAKWLFRWYLGCLIMDSTLETLEFYTTTVTVTPFRSMRTLALKDQRQHCFEVVPKKSAASPGRQSVGVRGNHVDDAKCQSSAPENFRALAARLWLLVDSISRGELVERHWN